MDRTFAYSADGKSSLAIRIKPIKMVQKLSIQVHMTHRETKQDYKTTTLNENPPKATHLAFFDVNILFSLSFRPPLSVKQTVFILLFKIYVFKMIKNIFRYYYRYLAIKIISF